MKLKASIKNRGFFITLYTILKKNILVISVITGLHFLVNNLWIEENIKGLIYIYAFLLGTNIIIHLVLYFIASKSNKGFIFLALSFFRMLLSCIFIYKSISFFNSIKSGVLHFFFVYFSLMILEIKIILNSSDKS